MPSSAPVGGGDDAGVGAGNLKIDRRSALKGRFNFDLAAMQVDDSFH